MTATTDLILTTSPAAATAGLWKSFHGGAEIKDAAASPTTGQISIIKVLGCRWKPWIKALHCGNHGLKLFIGLNAKFLHEFVDQGRQHSI